MPGPQVVELTINAQSGGVPRVAENQLALVAPLDSSATVSADEVTRYRSTSTVKTDHGSGSLLATGFEAARRAGASGILLIGSDETVVVDESITTPTTSGLTGGTVANIPLHEVTGVSVDGASMTTITYTDGDVDPSTLSPATLEAIINTKTGKVEVGTAQTGSGAGILVSYKYIDLDATANVLADEAVEIITFAGWTVNNQYFGMWDALATKAEENRWKVKAALDSGVTETSVDALLTSLEDKRFSFIAAKGYTGDLTSAYAADRATAPINGTGKVQPAPSGITFTEGYLRSEYGDAISPSANTWNKIGVNAVYKTASGEYRVAADRARVPTTDFYRFSSTIRVQDNVVGSVEAQVLAARQESEDGLPFNQQGINGIEGRIRTALDDAVTRNFIKAGYGLDMPTDDDVPQADREDRLLDNVIIDLTLTGQIEVVFIDTNIQL